MTLNAAKRQKAQCEAVGDTASLAYNTAVANVAFLTRELNPVVVELLDMDNRENFAEIAFPPTEGGDALTFKVELIKLRESIRLSNLPPG